MSWETSVEGIRDEIVLKDIPFPEADREVQEEVQDQYNVALIAAKNLLRYTGQPDDIVLVHLSGHANPDHSSSRDYGAPEYIKVQVDVVAEAAEEAPEEITRKETPKKETKKKKTPEKETETSKKKSPTSKKETDSE